MAAGGSAIRKEFDRLSGAVRDGGYIPGCDHAVPPDVTWSGFVEYSRLLPTATGSI